MQRRLTRINHFREHPLEVQEQLFASLLKQAQATEWGRQYGYADAPSRQEFARRVPVGTYEQLYPEIEKVLRGQPDVLWPGRPRWFAKSSGTTNARSKYIPVTTEALQDCHYRAGRDMLALATHFYPQERLVRGKTLSLGGTHTANPREVAERAITARGARVVEIRSREVRGRAVDAAELVRLDTGYATSIGEERFLELATPGDRIAAFARVALPAGRAVDPELAGAALLREVHVYGSSLRLGERSGAAAQHAGLGRALVEAAAGAARSAGFRSLAVISAVGTRPYYRRLGFADGDLYQHRALS